MQGKKTALRITASILIFVLLFTLLQKLVVPKYASASREGNLIGEYYDETREHDVLFLGDCEIYGNFSPVELWRSCGLTSYLRASAEQLIWQSYYLLEEMLTRETPKAVVLNCLALRHNEPDSEAYNRMTLDGMRLSPSKLRAVRASMTEDESFLSYLFPLLRFHSRWSELEKEDLTYLFSREKVSFEGYMLRCDVQPETRLPSVRPLPDYRFGENAMNYLDKITALCREKGICLILIKAPVDYPYWYDEWDSQVGEYADENGLRYVNLLREDTGIDMQTDSYDGGLHLNVKGAEKATRFLGRIILEEIGPADHSQDAELTEIWQKKADAYDAEIALQEAELAAYGCLPHLGQKGNN